MLAERKLPDTSKLKYPLYASPKLDGIRALVIDGQLRSRALKPIPNAFVAARFSSYRFNGLDGELVLGDPTAKDVYRTTQKAVSRIEGTPDVKFYVFDIWNSKLPYEKRYSDLESSLDLEQCPEVVRVESTLVKDEKELLSYEEQALDAGFEGLILRSPQGPYKFGRSTMREGYMLKLKRFEDSEARVVGCSEEMHNANEATRNELGRTERSSHKANLVPKGRLGKLIVVDDERFPGVQFEVGTGFTALDRESLWFNRSYLNGRIVKYKYFAHGVKDRPRHPVFQGWREPWDQ